ncbi:LysR family transcriptional regulator [Isoptericola halotolerans]|uniref:LysR family transcriptional regulator n=1 Tax=Isoptericola halotolerans TaxID=300560 RepID=UPI00388D97E0
MSGFAVSARSGAHAVSRAPEYRVMREAMPPQRCARGSQPCGCFHEGLLPLDVKGVRAFVEVASMGSVTSAAESLGWAQSTVSKQLQNFEYVLGRQLFHRTGRGMELTRAGDIALPYAVKIVRSLEALTNGPTDALTGDGRFSSRSIPERRVVMG